MPNLGRIPYGALPAGQQNYDYFIDAFYGDDANSGRAGSPWRTLAPMNGMSASKAAGRGFALMGGVWRETITPVADNMRVGGVGNIPSVVNAADRIKGFTLTTGIVFAAAAATSPNQVFINNAMATKASSLAAITDGQWWWVGGTLSIASSLGNPDVLDTIVESSVRDYNVDTNGKNGLGLDSLVLLRANANESGVYAHFQPVGHDYNNLIIQEAFGNGIHVNGTAAGANRFRNITLLRNGLASIWHSHVDNPGQILRGIRAVGNGWRSGQTVGLCAGLALNMVGGEVSYFYLDANGSGGDAGGHEHGLYLNAPSSGLILPEIHHGVSVNHAKGYAIKSRAGGNFHHIVGGNNGWGFLDFEGNGTVNVQYQVYQALGYLNALAGGAGIFLQKDTGTISFKGYNITLYQNSAGSSAGEVDVNSDMDFYDMRNLIVSASANGKYVRMVAQTHSPSHDFAQYFGSSDAGNPFVYGGTQQNFATFKGHGFDAHSIVSDPQFKNAAGFDFTTLAGAPGKGVGANIPGFTDALSSVDLGYSQAA